MIPAIHALRRLDVLREPTKLEVLDTFEKRKHQPGLDHILPTVSKQAFDKTSRFTLATLAGDPATRPTSRQTCSSTWSDFRPTCGTSSSGMRSPPSSTPSRRMTCSPWCCRSLRR